MKSWFEVKARAEKDFGGQCKQVVETYLVDALTQAEAEERAIMERGIRQESFKFSVSDV